MRDIQTRCIKSFFSTSNGIELLLSVVKKKCITRQDWYLLFHRLASAVKSSANMLRDAKTLLIAIPLASIQFNKTGRRKKFPNESEKWKRERAGMLSQWIGQMKLKVNPVRQRVCCRLNDSCTTNKLTYIRNGVEKERDMPWGNRSCEGIFFSFIQLLAIRIMLSAGSAHAKPFHFIAPNRELRKIIRFRHFNCLKATMTLW